MDEFLKLRYEVNKHIIISLFPNKEDQEKLENKLSSFLCEPIYEQEEHDVSQELSQVWYCSNI